MPRPSANPQGNARESKAHPPEKPSNVLERPEPPDAPKHLGAVGVRTWNELWAFPIYWPPSDRWIIERYASLQDRRAHFMAVLESEGYTAVGSQGQLVAHPMARLLLDVEGKLTPLEDRLGLSPESRARLGLVVEEAKSKLEEFLEGAQPDVP